MNTTVDGAPDKLSSVEVKGIIDKAPPPGPANPIDPIGKMCGKVWLVIILYIGIQWINGTLYHIE